MKVFLDLLEKSEREEDFVMHEKWGKEERYSKSRYVHSYTINTEETYPRARCLTKPGRDPRGYHVHRIERSSRKRERLRQPPTNRAWMRTQ